MQTHSYTSEFGLVKCQAEPAADNRFAAIIILVSPSALAKTWSDTPAPGSDAMAVDAVARARAWAEAEYPRKIPDARS